MADPGVVSSPGSSVGSPLSLRGGDGRTGAGAGAGGPGSSPSKAAGPGAVEDDAVTEAVNSKEVRLFRGLEGWRSGFWRSLPSCTYAALMQRECGVAAGFAVGPGATE